VVWHPRSLVRHMLPSVLQELRFHCDTKGKSRNDKNLVGAGLTRPCGCWLVKTLWVVGWWVLAAACPKSFSTSLQPLATNRLSHLPAPPAYPVSAAIRACM